MTESLPRISAVENGVTIDIKVKPGASGNSIGDVHDGRLKVFVTAQPEKSKANSAVINLISKSFKIPKSRVEIIKGHANPQKTVLIQGVSLSEIKDTLFQIIKSQT